MWLVFLFFALKANAQLSPVDPHPTPVGFACEPTPFDDEPCIQSQCDDIQRPRTTTHPAHPINVFNRAHTNTFDWRTSTYPVLLTSGSQIPSPLLSPFYQGDNGNVSQFTYTNKQDMRPEDGWEVLKYDFGGALSAAGIPTHVVNIPYLVLYNRFLGKMRFFIARGDKPFETNYAQIAVSLDGSNKSSILDLHHGYLRPLDMPFVAGKMQSGARVVNVAGYWSYAEFPMIYDPCTCEYNENSILISVNNVKVSSINLSGTIQGTLVSNNGTSVIANDDSDGFTLKEATQILNTYVKGYNIANKFIDDSKKIIENTRGVGSDYAPRKAEALNQLGSILNNSDALMRTLRGGLQSVPYITAALSIYDMFAAGGTSSGPQKVAIMPMALNASVRLSGTIEQSVNYKDITLATPGSNISTTLSTNNPYYNEVLGVFNLLETPKIKRNLDYRITGDPDNYYESYTLNYSLANPIKYVINPASGLEVQDVQAALLMRDISIVSSSFPTNFDNIISTGMATTKHVNLFTSAPQGTFTTNWMPAYQSETVDKNLIWLQLILNLRRKDGKGSNVLLVVTYPTTFVEGMGACKDCFKQSTQSEVRSFCTDKTSIYRVNRISAKEKPDETAMQSTIQGFKAFPNPVDNLLHISYDSETEQTVKAWLTDVTGRTVSDILEQKAGKGNFNLDLPTQDLPEGLHLLIFEVNGIKKVQKVVIRH